MYILDLPLDGQKKIMYVKGSPPYLRKFNSQLIFLLSPAMAKPLGGGDMEMLGVCLCMCASVRHKVC